MSGSEEIRVSEIRDASHLDLVFPEGISFFWPHLRYYIKETLEVGGEVSVSRTPDGTISGLFIYDGVEKVGTVYTRSRESFDFFYAMRPFNLVFAELLTEHENEVYDIYSIDLRDLALTYRFSHEISIADGGHADEIERFMDSTHPGLNKRWVRVAIKSGDRCFTVRLGEEIAGMGWLSFINGIGRLHSLYVKPQFRKIGIGEDLLNARLYWLRSKGARSAFSEISRHNIGSSRIAAKGNMNVTGQVYGYYWKAKTPGQEAQSTMPADTARSSEPRIWGRPARWSPSALRSSCTSPWRPP
jgi:GNAT superfamily N-acetyltransferase